MQTLRDPFESDKVQHPAEARQADRWSPDHDTEPSIKAGAPHSLRAGSYARRAERAAFDLLAGSRSIGLAGILAMDSKQAWITAEEARHIVDQRTDVRLDEQGYWVVIGPRLDGQVTALVVRITGTVDVVSVRDPR